MLTETTGTDDETSLEKKDQEQVEIENAVSCFDPRSSLHRYLILVFLCLAGFGSYFCDDNPAALQDKFETDLNMTTTEYAVLYSTNVWPSVVLSFLGGFLVDRVFGIRLGTIIYLVALTFGQLVFALGGMVNSQWIMLSGRFIFGIGDESLSIALTNFAVLWFKKKELNMVFGIQMSVSRFASILNFWIMETLYSAVSYYYQGSQAIGIILFITSLACIFSTLCSVILGWLDKRAESVCKRDLNPNDEVVKLSDVTTFKLNFWLVSFVCMSFYIAVFIFVAFGKIFFEETYHTTPDGSNQLNSMAFTISAFACPFLGILVDKTGKIVMWIFLSIFSVFVGHCMLLVTVINPFISMSVIGIGYSMFSTAVWSLIPMIVPEHQLGTAYGMLHSIKNAGLSVFSILGGVIVDYMGYFVLQIFLILWAMLCLIGISWIWINDINSDGLLNSTPEVQDLYHKSCEANKKVNQNLELADRNYEEGSIHEIPPKTLSNQGFEEDTQ